MGSSHDTLAFWGNPHYHGFTCLRGLNTGTQLLCVLSCGSGLQPAALKGITAPLLGQPRGGVSSQYRLKSFMGASYLIPPILLCQKYHEENPLLFSCTCTKKAKHDFWCCYVILNMFVSGKTTVVSLVYGQTTCLKVKSKRSEHYSLQILEEVE